MYQHLKTFAKPRGKALERTVTMMLRSMCLRLEGMGFTAIGTPYKRGMKVRGGHLNDSSVPYCTTYTSIRIRHYSPANTAPPVLSNQGDPQ